jgi:tRNA dimethylallyltransferase
MISEGLVEEVANLSAAGFGWGLPSMSSLGYAQVGQYLRGEITLGQALAMIKRETRRFIRHQYTWFRLDDPRIRWFDLDKTNVTDIVSTVQGWLNRAGLESQPSVKDG